MADGPRPVDVEVGRRLKQRRTLLGMSQERLGELLGVTYQQVQKYERGTNRIGSSRLHDICRILGVTAAYFFDGADAPPAYGGLAEASAAGFVLDGPPMAPHPAPAPAAAPLGALIDDRETLELVRAFRRIRDPLIRRRLYELARALADLAQRPTPASDPGPS